MRAVPRRVQSLSGCSSSAGSRPCACCHGGQLRRGVPAVGQGPRRLHAGRRQSACPAARGPTGSARGGAAAGGARCRMAEGRQVLAPNDGGVQGVLDQAAVEAALCGEGLAPYRATLSVRRIPTRLAKGHRQLSIFDGRYDDAPGHHEFTPEYIVKQTCFSSQRISCSQDVFWCKEADAGISCSYCGGDDWTWHVYFGQ